MSAAVIRRGYIWRQTYTHTAFAATSMHDFLKTSGSFKTMRERSGVWAGWRYRSRP